MRQFAGVAEAPAESITGAMTALSGHPQTPDSDANRAQFIEHIGGTLRALQQMVIEGVAVDSELQERALSLLDFALSPLGQPHWAAACQLLLTLAPAMEQAGQRAIWGGYLQQGVACAAALGEAHNQAALTLHLALQWQLQGQWPAATALYRQVIDALENGPATDVSTVEATERRRLQGEALNRLAYLARLQGNLAEAQAQIDRALQRLTSSDPELEYSYFVLGTIAHDRRDFGMAEAQFRQSLHHCQALGRQPRIAQRTRDVGLALAEQGKLDQARALLEEAIARFERLAAPVERAVAQMNLGIVYSRLGDSLHALDCYAAAKPIFQQVHDELHLALLYNNQGVDYRRLGRHAEAIYVLEASAAIRSRLTNRRALANVLDNLGRAYADLARFAEAVATFDRALATLATLDPDPGTERLRTGIERQRAQALRQRTAD